MIENTKSSKSEDSNSDSFADNPKKSFKAIKESKEGRFLSNKEYNMLRSLMSTKKSKQPNIKTSQIINEQTNVKSTIQTSTEHKFTSTNWSTNLLTTKYLNSKLLITPYSSLVIDSITQKYTIKINEERLRLQSLSFAQKIISMQEINYYRILRNYGSSDKFQSLLSEAFIYSFYKCLLYGIFDKRISDQPLNGICIAGHSVLYQSILCPSFTFRNGDIDVRYQFVFDEKDVKNFVSKAESHSFIKNYIINNEFRFTLENHSLDNILANLKIELDKVGSLVTLSKFDDPSILNTYLSRNTFGLLNSFYVKGENKEQHWRHVHADGILINNPQLLLGKALFISEFDETTSNFHETVKTDDLQTLIKYEVSSVCGSVFPNPIDLQQGLK